MAGNGRENCLQAPRGYKARPLNGIWATGPSLHNGSVANRYELLLPAAQRAPELYLGYRGFDARKVAFVSTTADRLDRLTGLTPVIVAGDEARVGNLNTGHEFRDGRGGGIIGPLLSDD
jgi:hypothetical protein